MENLLFTGIDLKQYPKIGGRKQYFQVPIGPKNKLQKLNPNQCLQGVYEFLFPFFNLKGRKYLWISTVDCGRF